MRYCSEMPKTFLFEVLISVKRVHGVAFKFKYLEWKIGEKIRSWKFIDCEENIEHFERVCFVPS